MKIKRKKKKPLALLSGSQTKNREHHSTDGSIGGCDSGFLFFSSFFKYFFKLKQAHKGGGGVWGGSSSQNHCEKKYLDPLHLFCEGSGSVSAARWILVLAAQTS